MVFRVNLQIIYILIKIKPRKYEVNNLNGREDRIWTCNHSVPNRVLYQVEPLPDIMASPRGVEPPTFWSVVKRSIQLSYEDNIVLKNIF